MTVKMPSSASSVSQKFEPDFSNANEPVNTKGFDIAKAVLLAPGEKL